MRYFLCLVVAIACEAARIPRQSEQTYFQNFPGVFPSNGASSYQNVESNQAGASFYGEYRGQDGNIGLGNEYFQNQVPIGGRHDLVNELAGVPFGDAGLNQADLKPQTYGRLNQPRDYDYQI